MAEPDIGVSRLWRWLRIAGLGVAIIVLVGFTAGYLGAHFERGGSFDLLTAAIAGGVTVAVMGCGWLIWREARKPTGEDPPTPLERLNRNLLIGSGLLGLVMAIVMIFAGDGSLDRGLFSNAPLPTGVAIMLIVMIGVIAPALSIYWHRAIDEQEDDAVKTAALFGIYTYWTLAPVWWLAWRGGFAPAPDGFIIYFATLAVVGVIWIRRKYL